MGELGRYQRIKTSDQIRFYNIIAVHLNLRFIVDSQLLTVLGRDVLQPGTGYLAGHQLLHGEATTRVLGQIIIALL